MDYRPHFRLPLFFFLKIYVKSLIGGIIFRGSFGDIRTFFLFIGYGRSGHTLIGSLLDAHENMIVALELNVLRYLKLGFSRQQILYLIMDNSRYHARRGRQWTGYSYLVKDQWQGKFTRLLVMGDKKGGMTSRILYHYPELLKKARKKLGFDIKFIHVLRNPYDIITTRAKRGRTKELELNDKVIMDTIEKYFRDVESVYMLKQSGEAEILDVRFEDFVSDPGSELKEICRFLGQETSENYLRSCIGIVSESPHKSRFGYDWKPEIIQKVRDGIDKYPFLSGYSFEEKQD